jgi:hypothetical protein
MPAAPFDGPEVSLTQSALMTVPSPP